jgi:hypothetical protein
MAIVLKRFETPATGSTVSEQAGPVHIHSHYFHRKHMFQVVVFNT